MCMCITKIEFNKIRLLISDRISKTSSQIDILFYYVSYTGFSTIDTYQFL